MKHLTGKKRLWLVPLFIGGIALLVYVTMFLWNSLMPGIFHLPQINYWEAAGLLILSRLLFGFGAHHRGWHHHRHNNFREKWEKMTPEQREKFSEHLRFHRHFCGEEHNEPKTDK